jgi:murein L,D-transpeptidase YcbB/YkuD
MEQALSHGTIAATLDSLAPQDPRYERLRRALAGLASGAEGERLSIRASLERLRWLPRKAQPDRLEVIVPEFALHVYRGGSEVGTYRIIVGKPSTPTPQFMADVSGIIVNPSWQVPKSIVAESVGTLIRRHPSLARKRGYVWSRAGGMLRVTQLPGPMNALARSNSTCPIPTGSTSTIRPTRRCSSATAALSATDASEWTVRWTWPGNCWRTDLQARRSSTR